jgi:hypothetical protein
MLPSAILSGSTVCSSTSTSTTNLSVYMDSHTHTDACTFDYGDLVHSPITIYSTPALLLLELQNKLEATIQLAKLDKTNLKIVSGRYKNKSTYPVCKSLVYKSDLYTPMCLESFLSLRQGLSLSWLWYHIFRRGLSECYWSKKLQWEN